MTVDFTFSDTVTGYVRAHDGTAVYLETLDGSATAVQLTGHTAVEQVRNLGEPHRGAGAERAALLRPGMLVSAYGQVYPSADGPVTVANRIVVMGDAERDYRFEHPGWWADQLVALADFYQRSQFPSGPADFAQYRTDLLLAGQKNGSGVQETDTISRLVYGMASAYMLTGKEEYLVTAREGTRYLREHMRFVDVDNDVTYWYHGVDLGSDGRERKLFTSEFGDDYEAIPAYEQIYALAGIVQTYRVTGEPALRADIDGTVRLFERFYADPRLGGYFSHLDPYDLDPHAPSLGPNRSRKNWNSVGDHTPAYLFNLYLATGEDRYLRMLEHTFDMIVSHFPGGRGSPFVQERFHADWKPDREWGWQQDRAVVGHNLKISWNLTRMNSLRAKHDYATLARQLADSMPALARDPRRGGWYDMVDRIAVDGRHRFVWHDRKAWWQQEQAILAYTLLAGVGGAAGDLRQSREAAAFYNAYFLDHEDGGVYFSVLAGGLPYLLGTERTKGSHSMSMYHASELCFLATVYENLLVHGEPVDLWFRPEIADIIRLAGLDSAVHLTDSLR